MYRERSGSVRRDVGGLSAACRDAARTYGVTAGTPALLHRRLRVNGQSEIFPTGQGFRECSRLLKSMGFFFGNFCYFGSRTVLGNTSHAAICSRVENLTTGRMWLMIFSVWSMARVKGSSFLAMSTRAFPELRPWRR